MWKKYFRQMMSDRRKFKRLGWQIEYDCTTKSARNYLWLHRGVPAKHWPQLHKIAEQGAQNG